MENTQDFHWQQYPEAEQLLQDLLEQHRTANHDIAALETRMRRLTSTRLFDWIDHLLMKDSAANRDRLETLGFVPGVGELEGCYTFHGARLPSVLLTARRGVDLRPGVAVRVESIADFLQCNGHCAEIEGTVLAPFRRCCVSVEGGSGLYAVERRGTRQMSPIGTAPDHQQHYLEAIERWQTLPRGVDEEEEAFGALFEAAERLIHRFGTDLAAHIVCLAERRYWLSRNHAARVQQMRQDVLGLGWANHDHHTFRSSRHFFARLVKLFVRLGFKRRERFYAGREAGWGAQVMENPAAGLTLFLDVDLAPEEVAVDFTAEPLAERKELGTVGLWCALHGDSILGAGMHHLAINALFTDLVEDLDRSGIEFMAPFSDFPYLKQSFSKGETWAVAPSRVEKLLDQGLITTEKAERFLLDGAIGSHLEDIQRREGYKGFNKKNVNVIIKETDPRR